MFNISVLYTPSHTLRRGHPKFVFTCLKLSVGGKKKSLLSLSCATGTANVELPHRQLAPGLGAALGPQQEAEGPSHREPASRGWPERVLG